MQAELDDCEQVVGTWNPVNQISNLYEAFDNAYDDINDFNAKDDTVKSGKSGAMPESSRATTISTKAKQFNTDLQPLAQKIKQMEDVSFD